MFVTAAVLETSFKVIQLSNGSMVCIIECHLEMAQWYISDLCSIYC